MTAQAKDCFDCWRASLSESERATLDADIARDGMGTVNYCDAHRRAMQEMFDRFGDSIIIRKPGDEPPRRFARWTP